MLKIFHTPRTRSQRVVWLAEEMGLGYELKPETFGQLSDEFMAANPTGALPAIVDGDVAMGESVAIMFYMLDRYGPSPLARKLGDPAYPDFLQYMVFGEGSLAAFLNPVIMTRFMAPEAERQNFTVGAAKRLFAGRVGALDKHLAAKGLHVAGDFSAADISVGYALGLGQAMDACELPSRVADYWLGLQARPGFKAMAAK